MANSPTEPDETQFYDIFISCGLVEEYASKLAKRAAHKDTEARRAICDQPAFWVQVQWELDSCVKNSVFVGSYEEMRPLFRELFIKEEAADGYCNLGSQMNFSRNFLYCHPVHHYALYILTITRDNGMDHWKTN